MGPAEPRSVAWMLAAAGLLLGVGALFSRAAARRGLPVLLLFLLLGVLARAGGLTLPHRELGFQVGLLALVLILFDGALNTDLAAARRALLPASLMASVGVVITALISSLVALALGLPREQALILGAVVSSTDAAAVFGVLRNSGLELRRRVAMTLELESGLNDPVAFVLVASFTAHALDGTTIGLRSVGEALAQLAIGAAIGIGLGLGAHHLLARARLMARGLYPILTISTALLTFGLAQLVGGSGLLAVYLAGLLTPARRIPYRADVLRVHDALAWLSQISMFVILGLLSTPERLDRVIAPGFLLALALVLVARPLAALLCLLPLRIPLRETLYVGWVGLRGAVPMVLAILPALAGVAGADQVFDVVFFVVVFTAIVPGAMVRRATRWLGQGTPGPTPPHAVLEMVSPRPLHADLASFHLERAAAVAGTRIDELPLPDGAEVVLVVRDDHLLKPAPDLVLLPGDQVHLFHLPGDAPFLRLMFGRAAESAD